MYGVSGLDRGGSGDPSLSIASMGPLRRAFYHYQLWTGIYMLDWWEQVIFSKWTES